MGVGHHRGGVQIGEVYRHLANEHRKAMAGRVNLESAVFADATSAQAESWLFCQPGDLLLICLKANDPEIFEDSLQSFPFPPMKVLSEGWAVSRHRDPTGLNKRCAALEMVHPQHGCCAKSMPLTGRLTERVIW